MKPSTAFAGILLGVLLQQPARGSAPSPEELDAWQAHEQSVKEAMAKAEPWKAAIAAEFAGEPEKAWNAVFLATYKHRLSDTGEAGAKARNSGAKAMLKAWKTVKAQCAKAKLDPVELAEAIYRFTNSDWAPVGGAKGPGLDKLATAKDYLAWAEAAIAAGKRARKSKIPPAEAWSNAAESYQVREPGDLAKADLKKNPRRF
jgi:hypothetical protein